MKVTTIEETRAFAGLFAADLPSRPRALVVTLSGDLGAGKTAFAGMMAEWFGVKENVTSPTFVIENIYKLNDQQWDRLIHIDAYRLKNAEELRSLGWEEIVVDPRNLIILEWPERVEELIPSEAIRVKFDIDGDARNITINGKDRLH